MILILIWAKILISMYLNISVVVWFISWQEVICSSKGEGVEQEYWLAGFPSWFTIPFLACVRILCWNHLSASYGSVHAQKFRKTFILLMLDNGQSIGAPWYNSWKEFSYDPYFDPTAVNLVMPFTLDMPINL